MHLLIPFAFAAGPAVREALLDLHLPNLFKLLQRLEPQELIEGDEYSLNPPQERALASAWGWSGGDGALPFASEAAKADGIDVGQQAWGLMTPVHWHVGQDHITLTDPEALRLGQAESRAIFEVVRGLFESEGFGIFWATPTRWYLEHDQLANLPSPSLDRVLGRNVDLWLQPPHGVSPAIRRTIGNIRRLQNEFQMLLYPHALTAARDTQGEPAVNSFWLSGCGRSQNIGSQSVYLENRLRAPMLTNDFAAWAEAWRAIDGDSLLTLLQHAQQGQRVSLTLCGERNAQTYATPKSKPTLIQRFKSRWVKSNNYALLETL